MEWASVLERFTRARHKKRPRHRRGLGVKPLLSFLTGTPRSYFFFFGAAFFFAAAFLAAFFIVDSPLTSILRSKKNRNVIHI